VNEIEQFFVLTAEQVDLLSLDRSERWFGVRLLDDFGKRECVITSSEAAFEATVNRVAPDEIEPPRSSARGSHRCCC
jgi:hypothetical protein